MSPRPVTNAQYATAISPATESILLNNEYMCGNKWTFPDTEATRLSGGQIGPSPSTEHGSHELKIGVGAATDNARRTLQSY